jgi:hypothetical protein
VAVAVFIIVVSRLSFSCAVEQKIFPLLIGTLSTFEYYTDWYLNERPYAEYTHHAFLAQDGSSSADGDADGAALFWKVIKLITPQSNLPLLYVPMGA